MASQRDGSIQSVQRALTLLTSFSREHPEWSIADLSRSTGLHKSVVSRLLATMAQLGFVVQDARTKLYSIGPQSFLVGSVYRPYQLLDQVARPQLEALAAQTGHSATLGIPDGDRVLTLHSVSGNRSVRVAFDVGERTHFHSGSVGKALLAGMPEHRIRAILGTNPLPKITPSTLTTVEAILNEVERIRQSGVAFSWEEAIVGVGGVAADVRNRAGESIAAIGIAYPTHLVTEEETAVLACQLREAADVIGRMIGMLSLEAHQRGELFG